MGANGLDSRKWDETGGTQMSIMNPATSRKIYRHILRDWFLFAVLLRLLH